MDKIIQTIANEFNIKYIQVIMGHSDTTTTTDIYSHFLKSSDKTAAEKLEQLFE